MTEERGRHVVLERPQAGTSVGVPFFDLTPSHAPIRDAILADIAAVFDSNAYTNGPAVEAFEDAFAAWCGASFCVGVASGLDAIRLALLASELRPGDEVVVPANTFVATLEAVTQAGGEPVVVDVDERDFTMDPEAVAAACGPRTRFVVPVHLYGQMAPMETLVEVARRHDLVVIEDACQAHGATRDGRRAGTTGRAGAFSFYPAKNLGALGDAGAVVTNDRELASAVRVLREHGQRHKYAHEREGYTARLDTIQAAVLLRKLALLESWTEDRRRAARFYAHALAGVGDLRLPSAPEGSYPVWHLYVVRTRDPDALARSLAEKRIATGRHYPVPVHLCAAYRRLGYQPGSFPTSEALAKEVLSLPLFPGITEEQLAAVVGSIKDFFDGG